MSSRASGIPSACWQIRAIAAALPSSMSKPGRAARARWMRSCTASKLRRSSRVCRRFTSGVAMDCTRQVISPPTPSTSRLVARMRRPGHCRRSVSTSCAVGATRCSQLSSTQRRSRASSTLISDSVGASPCWAVKPSALMTASGTSSPSVNPASSTNQTPSRNDQGAAGRPRERAASCRCRRRR